MNDYEIGTMRENLNNALLKDYLDNRDNYIKENIEEEIPSHCAKFTLEQINKCNFCLVCFFTD